MNKRCLMRLILGLAAVFAFYCTPANAATNYALATSTSKLYLLSSDGGSISSQVLYDFGTSGQRSVAVTGNKILVTDTSSHVNQLLVLNLIRKDGVYSVNTNRTVSLSSGDLAITEAGSIAVDKSGGIYITGGMYMAGDTPEGNYAYLPSYSSAVQVSSLGNPSFPQVGAAAVGSGVMIAYQNAAATGASYATYLDNGSPSGTPIALGTRYPVAVAGSSSYAYIVSKALVNDFSTSYLTMYNTSNGTTISPQALPGVIGGITSFIFNDENGTDTNYLALIGTVGGNVSMWKAAIDASGATGEWMLAGGTLYSGTDLTGANQQCSAAPDGTAVWFTQPGAGHVGLVNTDTWTMAAGLDINDQISSIIGFDAPGSAVPEPSSLAALASFAAAGLTMLRRRHTL